MGNPLPLAVRRIAVATRRCGARLPAARLGAFFHHSCVAVGWIAGRLRGGRSAGLCGLSPALLAVIWLLRRADAPTHPGGWQTRRARGADRREAGPRAWRGCRAPPVCGACGAARRHPARYRPDTTSDMGHDPADLPARGRRPRALKLKRKSTTRSCSGRCSVGAFGCPGTVSRSLAVRSGDGPDVASTTMNFGTLGDG